ncbi:MAG: hypothetical protein JL56_11345 [Desulfotomaculum sp. BICA1-6]|nr:MAG: hypothetical protein VR67_13365 [Peptococcaceae bacterium BRH_c8a]KJS73367.1 MAG: hypothetical protein JL56_11345 [Desulfotomaculum sp. BICA1-6]
MDREAEIEITGINHQGEGVGRLEGMVIFVPGTVPGERVSVRLTEVRRSYARGRLLKNLAPSNERVAPGCTLAANCGGCALQHMAYPAQLRLKTELVRQTLARTGSLPNAPLRDTIGMAVPWHYRNNVQFKVRREAGKVELGFYARESHSIVKAGDEEGICLLAHRELNRVAAVVQILLGELDHGVPLPGEVALRRGSTGEMMVILTGDTNTAQVNRGPSRYHSIAKKVISIPGVVTVAEHIRPRGKKPGGRYITLAGRDYIIDELDGLKFRISAPSFYQVNPVQTVVLYRKTLEYCSLQGDEVIADAYSGVGTITLYIARHAKDLRGYEVLRGAVEDARANAALNGIKNARFYAGAVEKVLPEQVAAGYRPDVVVLDPPRAGCQSEVLQAAAQSGARRVVYVSCDPATLARDIARLGPLGYQVADIQPVDMFPHTAHVECVALMERS